MSASQCLACGTRVPAQTREQAASDKPVARAMIGQRHGQIFALFDGLGDDQSLTLTTDHEPRPLHAEFEQKRSGRFSWQQRRVMKQNEQSCHPGIQPLCHLSAG